MNTLFVKTPVPGVNNFPDWWWYAMFIVGMLIIIGVNIDYRRKKQVYGTLEWMLVITAIALVLVGLWGTFPAIEEVLGTNTPWILVAGSFVVGMVVTIRSGFFNAGKYPDGSPNPPLTILGLVVMFGPFVVKFIQFLLQIFATQ